MVAIPKPWALEGNIFADNYNLTSALGCES